MCEKIFYVPLTIFFLVAILKHIMGTCRAICSTVLWLLVVELQWLKFIGESIKIFKGFKLNGVENKIHGIFWT
jgi:hypothetical protein